MFYSEYSGVVPDIQIMAKGIAGGLPLSAIVAKNYVMKGQKPGSMGGTYCELRFRLVAVAHIVSGDHRTNELIFRGSL
jgi:acetylornithine/succinyldiaminopimelate/putrescine aminotransferase